MELNALSTRYCADTADRTDASHSVSERNTELVTVLRAAPEHSGWQLQTTETLTVNESLRELVT